MRSPDPARTRWPVNRRFKSAAVSREVSVTRSARSRGETTRRSIPSMKDGLRREGAVVEVRYSAVRAARHQNRWTARSTAARCAHQRPALDSTGEHARYIAARRVVGNARRTKRGFAVAEASNGASAINGMARPRMRSHRGSGRRSICAEERGQRPARAVLDPMDRSNAGRGPISRHPAVRATAQPPR
jgi:hypothetical protein